MLVLISAINAFAQILTWLLVARALCSWFIRGSGGTAYKIYHLLTLFTEPIVAPCRKITSRFSTGMFDFSVLLALVFVMIAREFLIRILLQFA